MMAVGPSIGVSDGKITAEFWERKNAEWAHLELANKAYSLCARQNPTELAKLLKMMLSKCTTMR